MAALRELARIFSTHSNRHRPPRRQEESSVRFSPQAIPERHRFWKDVIAFAHRPIESKAHYLAKHFVERVGYLRCEEESVLMQEFSSRLEVVSHVKRAT